MNNRLPLKKSWKFANSWCRIDFIRFRDVTALFREISSILRNPSRAFWNRLPAYRVKKSAKEKINIYRRNCSKLVVHSGIWLWAGNVLNLALMIFWMFGVDFLWSICNYTSINQKFNSLFKSLIDFFHTLFYKF